eukprot:TRINITY_DN11217_c0_g1::TRINITY_DN11217_c0_g1_i1::g.6558::m.6558 TRINITY_DN11217_c0_g1::TRINITY_DN11217_c0_g1_i1::g.6558  ORF type:complete len:123 (+),score=22.66,DUF3329/PF11808.3/1e+03,DUF3329/PF11808.3/0.4 TRINITY_DN11217_c0_g1_i1:1016-1384(+)
MIQLPATVLDSEEVIVGLKHGDVAVDTVYAMAECAIALVTAVTVGNTVEKLKSGFGSCVYAVGVAQAVMSLMVLAWRLATRLPATVPVTAVFVVLSVRVSATVIAVVCWCGSHLHHFQDWRC